MRDTARSEPDRARPRERRSAPPELSHDVLELQRTVGNRAARTILAREPTEADTRREATIDVDGVGVIPLLSWSFGVSNPTTGGTGGRGGEAPKADISVSSEQGDHSPKLAQSVTRGKHIATAVITGRGVTVTLKNVYVSSYSVSSGGSASTEQWTLSYESIEYKYGTGG